MAQVHPLHGIRVLDFSRFMQGPHCSEMFGDLGADVIKVERPKAGDENRVFPFSRIRGVNAFLLALNRNKRSFIVNLKHPEAKAVVERLRAPPTCSSRTSGQARWRSSASATRRWRVRIPG